MCLAFACQTYADEAGPDGHFELPPAGQEGEVQGYLFGMLQFVNAVAAKLPGMGERIYRFGRTCY